MDIAQEAPEVTLVFACGFVLGALEGSVADVGFAVLAPVFRLENLIGVSFYAPMEPRESFWEMWSTKTANLLWTSSILT